MYDRLIIRFGNCVVGHDDALTVKAGFDPAADFPFNTPVLAYGPERVLYGV